MHTCRRSHAADEDTGETGETIGSASRRRNAVMRPKPRILSGSAWIVRVDTLVTIRYFMGCNYRQQR